MAEAHVAKKARTNGAAEWHVQSGKRAAGIQNPIRKIMDTIAGKENPDKRVISLAQGDPTTYPHLRPSDVMVDATVRALQGGAAHGYQPSQGNGACRAAIAEEYTVPGRPAIKPDDIFMTLGCSEGLSHCIAALAVEGSNMLLPSPGFPLNEVLCDYHGVEIRHYKLMPEHGWEIDIDSVIALADENTTAILINNPSNPCGSVYSKEQLAKVMEVAERLKIVVIADEVYSKMSFDGSYVSCAAATDKVPVLSICALSKRWCAPGWRLGWVIVHDTPEGVLKAADIPGTLMKLCQVSLGPPAPLQAAVPAIMKETPQSWYDAALLALQNSAKVCMRRCAETPGLEVASDPKGAMYLMVRIQPGVLKDIKDDVDFSGALLREESIAVLPGACFHAPGYFRVVFAAPPETLEEAWNRIEAFCKRRVQ